MIKHRATDEKYKFVLHVLSCLESQVVELSYEEHDRITADTQAVTHVAFLRCGIIHYFIIFIHMF
jgi:prephenate dehydrogenase (NADP+)